MHEIAIITQYFYPNLASTAQLMTDLATGISNQGYSVKVFTSSTSSKIPQGFLNTVKVVRLPSLFQPRNSILGKITSSLFFLLGCLLHVIFRTSNDTPLLIASNPPYAGIIGIVFKLLKGGDFYFLLQDIFPESAVISGIINANNIFFIFFSQLIYQTCKCSKYTIVLSSSMKAYLEKKHPPLKELNKIIVIENWAIENIPKCDKQNNKFALQHNLNQVFTVLYSGNLGRLHDIESIASAAQLLIEYHIQFVFIGDGPKQKVLEHYVQKYQLKNILLIPFQPREVIPTSLTACDVSLVSLVEGAEQIIAPCKLYGMLAAGRAIVSISAPNSYIDQLLTTYNCGINCPPNQPEKLANLLNELAAEPLKVKAMGERARQLYEKRYTFKRALDEYEKLLF